MIFFFFPPPNSGSRFCFKNICGKAREQLSQTFGKAKKKNIDTAGRIFQQFYFKGYSLKYLC